MKIFHNLDDLSFAVDQLCSLDQRFNSIREVHGAPALRRLPQGLHGLLMIITEQFLSLQAASAIWTRLEERLAPFSPEVVLACSQDELVSLGLSNAKARSFHAAAKFQFDFNGLDEVGISQKLQEIYGVGPWTADIYLLSVVCAADAWPAGDLALRISLQDLFKLPARPAISEMIELADGWRPWRAVAARLLWSHYRGLKGIQQAS